MSGAHLCLLVKYATRLLDSVAVLQCVSLSLSHSLSATYLGRVTANYIRIGILFDDKIRLISARARESNFPSIGRRETLYRISIEKVIEVN